MSEDTQYAASIAHHTALDALRRKGGIDRVAFRLDNTHGAPVREPAEASAVRRQHPVVAAEICMARLRLKHNALRRASHRCGAWRGEGR